jgi:hypothetical protein
VLEKNKNKYLKEQIPPKKHLVGPSRGISIPLQKGYGVSARKCRNGFTIIREMV